MQNKKFKKQTYRTHKHTYRKCECVQQRDMDEEEEEEEEERPRCQPEVTASLTVPGNRGQSI